MTVPLVQSMAIAYRGVGSAREVGGQLGEREAATAAVTGVRALTHVDSPREKGFSVN